MTPHRRFALALPLQRSLILASIVFLLSFVLAMALIWQLERYRRQETRAAAATLAAERAYAIQMNIDHALSATYALAAMVRQGKGELPDFAATAAQMLPFYPGASALALAPNGVVTQIVPLAGNEKAIGHNLTKDPARDKETFLARDTGKLTLAGPFTLVQGGMAAAGRLPVYLEDDHGGSSFWGLISVLIRFPDALSAAQLPRLAEHGFDYELWRVHPDSGKKQTIAASNTSTLPLRDPVEQTLQVPNATWTLSIYPRAGWSNRPLAATGIALGLLFSLLMAWLAKLLSEARSHELQLESKVAQRTADLQRFAEISAHHLQEPTRRIANYVGLLQKQLCYAPAATGDTAGDASETQISLEFIAEQTRYLQTLLRDIELFLSADQPRDTITAVDANKVVDRVQARMSEVIARCNATLSIGRLPSALIDAPRLNDIFSIALDNALQHGAIESRLWRDGSSATDSLMHSLHIDVSGERLSHRVRYRIADNGVGVEAEYFERVFRVFERLSSSSDGTGIGLAILRRIAESSGGRAWIERASIGGCCVVVELPAGAVT